MTLHVCVLLLLAFLLTTQKKKCVSLAVPAPRVCAVVFPLCVYNCHRVCGLAVGVIKLLELLQPSSATCSSTTNYTRTTKW